MAQSQVPSALVTAKSNEKHGRTTDVISSKVAVGRPGAPLDGYGVSHYYVDNIGKHVDDDGGPRSVTISIPTRLAGDTGGNVERFRKRERRIAILALSSPAKKSGSLFDKVHRLE